MSGLPSANEQFHGSTLQVTLRLLRRFMPGDTGSVFLGFVLVLAATGMALLQPWPLKLVLDCVIGHDSLPAVFSGVMQTLGANPDSKLGLLVLLCLGLLFIELLLGIFNVISAYLLNS